MSPAQYYARDLAEGKIVPDDAQAMAIAELEEVYRRMLAFWSKPRGLLQAFLDTVNRGNGEPVATGLYLWGGVGRGKTYLMDLFYRSLPGDRKLRMHFHRFMQMVHRELYANKGNRNPLELVAESIKARADILCFDEFFVSDIGDAMILGNLLEALFERGMVLIATSNIVPGRLYERGLQRQRFLPAITLLEKHTKILNVDGGTDYRLRSLEKAGIYHTPLGEAAEAELLACFEDLTRGMGTAENRDLEILGRDIRARYWSEGVVWFEFKALCDGPRSAADYIEISQLFHTVLVSDVPVFRDKRDDDRARRFISLVDEFYDQNVKLILSAEAPLEALYQGRELAFPFERTRSRLLEMQTHAYLAREHCPEGYTGGVSAPAG